MDFDDGKEKAITPSGDLPSGLECLIPINKLTIIEEVNGGSMSMSSHKVFKRYHILDGSGCHLFFCTETKELTRTDCCFVHKDFSPIRPWIIEAFHDDDDDDEDISIMTGSRSRLKTGCFSMKQNCKVSSSGQRLGKIQQVIKLCADESILTILDGKGTPVILIKAHQHPGGKLMSSKRCHEFPVMTMDKRVCGMISWQCDSVWEPSNFGIEFPEDLDVKIKALLIYATFMIEFCYVQADRQHRRK